MFGRRRKRQVPPYDKTGKVPVIRSSICTGEQVAGFKDLSSGRFEELMLIRSRADLLEFTRLYQVEEDEIRREW
ncbi:MAG: aspartate dehydrogenase [Oscillospiraceae bacterium]|nr:aspartate dehydrogenase [Oscillospiraceae bacterium]